MTAVKGETVRHFILAAGGEPVSQPAADLQWNSSANADEWSGFSESHNSLNIPSHVVAFQSVDQ